MSAEGTIIPVNLDSAPPSVRAEIEKLGKNSHSQAAFDNLTPSTRKWLLNEFKETRGDFIASIKGHYNDTCEHLDVAVMGITSLERVMSKDDACAINLKLYNACAKFCREYNMEKMT